MRHLGLASMLTIAAIFFGAAHAEAPYQPPRTPDGRPDLQGVWTNASLTGLQRPSHLKDLVIPSDEARRLEENRSNALQRANAPTDPNEGAPTDGNANAGYNSFWLDPGSRYGVVGGEARSSWIVDPADGQIPYSEAGLEAYRELLGKVRTTFDGPEIRPQGERCIVGFGSTNGPPMTNVAYNNNYQIVQTPDHVVILSEMIHDARIVPIGDAPPGERFAEWMGNGLARWEGDTLVVETKNFHPDIRLRPNMNQSYYIGDNATVVERFTRVADDAIHYEFSVSEPVTFTQTWRGEMTLRATSEPIYEYACHEGNYAMPGILAGARADERRGVAPVGGFDAE